MVRKCEAEARGFGSAKSFCARDLLKLTAAKGLATESPKGEGASEPSFSPSTLILSATKVGRVRCNLELVGERSKMNL